MVNPEYINELQVNLSKEQALLSQLEGKMHIVTKKLCDLARLHPIQEGAPERRPSPEETQLADELTLLTDEFCAQGQICQAARCTLAAAEPYCSYSS